MLDNKELGNKILNEKDRLAKEILDQQYQENPLLWEKWGQQGYDRCLEDTAYHLSYLAESIKTGSPAVFHNYIKWARELFENLGIPTEDLSRNLILIQEIVSSNIPEAENLISERIDKAMDMIESDYIPEMTYIDTSKPLGNAATEYLNRLLYGKRSIAVKYILDLVNSGINIKDVYIHIFQPTQYEVGRLWQTGKISVAQEHYATAVTQMAMSQLYSKIFETPKIGKNMIATCPSGELHEIGVRMLADIFELSGWDTYYLGANTPESGILSTIEKEKPDLIAISAAMTYHLSKVENLINYIRKSNYPDIKILVGGYVFKSVTDLWKEVGADGFAPDAIKALELVNNMN